MNYILKLNIILDDIGTIPNIPTILGPDHHHFIVITGIRLDIQRGQNLHPDSDYATRPQDLYYEVMDPDRGSYTWDAQNLRFLFDPTHDRTHIGGYIIHPTTDANQIPPPPLAFPMEFGARSAFFQASSVLGIF